jgi:hypothetical protein
MKKCFNLRAAMSFVGTWKEEENPIYTTTVRVTIATIDGVFSVSGVDESDGTVLKISHVGWDGEKLYFESLYPPTKHEASHEFVVVEEGRAKHTTHYSDKYGKHVVDEVWIRTQ